MAHVIRIHSGYKLILAVFHAFIQRIPQAPVPGKSMNIESISKFFLHFRNHFIQWRIQRAIADQHKIICGNSLVINALHALSQVVGMFFIVNGHENGIILRHK